MPELFLALLILALAYAAWRHRPSLALPPQPPACAKRFARNFDATAPDPVLDGIGTLDLSPREVRS